MKIPATLCRRGYFFGAADTASAMNGMALWFFRNLLLVALAFRQDAKRGRLPTIGFPASGCGEMTEAALLDDALSNPVNAELLRRLRSLEIAECHLAAGCLFQAVWNRISGRAPDWGVKDYDVFYFDEQDVSWEAEDRVIARVADRTSDLGIRVEVRNQARVHLWYRDRFGSEYPRLKSAQDGIDRYLVACTCVGIEVRNSRVYAPNGLHDLTSGMLRMNPRHPEPDLFRRKAASYLDRWPWLTIVPPSLQNL